MGLDTLPKLLERAAALPETGLRLLDREEKALWLPWPEIWRRAQEVAGGLQELGIGRGERVALVYPTAAEFFHAFFGVLLAGGVPVPLYPPVRLGRLAEYHRRTARMVELAGARLLLADRRARRILGEMVARARPTHGCRTLGDLPPGRPRSVKVGASDLALVQFSSGTTTDPKPVALSHRALLAQVRILNGLWPDTPELRHSGVSWLPLYHDMGLIGCVFAALERPATLTLIPPEVFIARPAVWLRAISRYRATVSPAPNFAYGLCVHKVEDRELEGVDLSSWRVALNGAEAIAPRVLREFQRRFSRWGLRPEALTPVYGLSEAALAVTFSPLDRPFVSRRFHRQALTAHGRAQEDPKGVEIVSVGSPLPGFRLRILDPEGRELPAGRVGRVWVQGPSLMEGYLDQPGATAEVLRDGWLDTGDLGFLFEGELYLTGRAKDVIILRGRNLSPEEFEQVVDRVPGARAGCAVAVSWLPEEGVGEVLTLLVEHHRTATPEEIQGLPEACRKAILSATGVAPDEVVVLPPGTLPRTSSGKLRRQEALGLYREGKLEPPAKVTPLALAGAFFRSGLAYARLRWEDGDAGSS